MPQSVTTFLMFTGDAEEAVRLYVSVFDGKLNAIQHWNPGEPGPEGKVKRASFSLAGHELVAMDSPAVHAFTFTPSTSLFVECASEAELDAAYAELAEGGKALMPLGAYGFSKKFGWVNDRFGVSWQLNWA
jgi:predicted 3-demethylubiquinone-9 3-methyltransferase (glyoxalase superfamily)